jgi:NAD+ kinase
LVVSLGGDGTLLKACQPAAPLGRPLLGINLGRRGYLAAHAPETLEQALDSALKGRLARLRLCMLEAKVLRHGKIVAHCLALNDVVVARGSWGRLASLEVRLDGGSLTHYLADGLIVATPTGSTAYALSAGGPLLQPGLPCLVLVPIAPHTLSHRPLVIANSAKIELDIPAGAKALGLSADGLLPVRLAAGDRVLVAKARTQALLLVPRGQDWREILRDKLGWRGY